MGSPTTEAGHQNDEDQVEVTLTQGFWMLETEVTQAMYFAVEKERPWQGVTYVEEGTNYPAAYVNWSDASDFCEQLTAAGRRDGVLTTKERIALPTEAQWEYAARAGTSTAYFFGNNDSELGQYAWCDKNTWNFDEKYAHLVGQKQPNPWGLLDMHGNVSEWCRDDYYQKYSGGRDPVNAFGSTCVTRGGSWYYDVQFARCAHRLNGDSARRSYTIGFRVIVSW